MKMTTMETVAGRMNEATLGFVRAVEFTTTEELAFGLNTAKDKAKDQANELGADAIVNLTLEIFEMSDGLFTAVVTGNAVRTSALPIPMHIFNRAANDDETFVRPSAAKKAGQAVSVLMH
jgi:predicted RNA-binding Zn ribbon-like protein